MDTHRSTCTRKTQRKHHSLDSKDEILTSNDRKKLLYKLQEFGDSLLDNVEHGTLKEKKKKNIKALQLLPSKGSDSNREIKLSSKRKQRKRTKMNSKQIVRTNKLNEEIKITASRDEKKVASSKESGVEVVVFEDPSKKRRKSQATPRNKQKAEIANNSKNIQKEDAAFKAAKYEVLKFGISGLDNFSREDARIQLAISLGAKPPKNKYVNYKQLMKSKKEELARKDETIDKLFGSSRGIHSTVTHNKKKSKRKMDDGYLDGQVGYYKHGVQKLSKQDLHTIKTTKLKKR